MTSIDRIAGVGAVAGGLALAGFSWHLDLGSWRMPGPGAWPFLLSLTLAVIGGWIFLHPLSPVPSTRSSKPRWGRLLLALGTLFGYILVLESLGYIVSMILLLLVQVCWVENRSWKTSLLTAVLGAVISFLVFGLWLKVMLPPGIIPLRGGS